MLFSTNQKAVDILCFNNNNNFDNSINDESYV